MSKTSKRKCKINPRKKPASKTDVEKAKKGAINQSVICAWAIMFSVMRDKFDWNAEQLQELWGYVDNLSDSVTKGYLKVEDLIKVLKEEDNIVLELIRRKTMRLIDADALHKEISDWSESIMYKDWVQSAIANAPTIALPSNAPLTFEELRGMNGKLV